MLNDKPKRPTIITVICIAGWLGALVSMLGLLFQMTSDAAVWNQVFPLLFALVGSFALYGFWSMQRWGVWLHGFLIVVNQIVLFILGISIYSLIFLIIPGIALGIGVFYYQKMTRGFSLTAAYGFGKKEAKITGIILLIGFVLSVAMGYLMYSLGSASENSINQDQSTETLSIEQLSFTDITDEDKNLAQQLRDIMPNPDDFPGNYEITSRYYTYSGDSVLTYSALWENQAANRVEEYLNEYGRPDGFSSVPDNIRTDAQNAQSFSVIISRPDDPDNRIDELRDESVWTELPQAQQALVTMSYVDSEGLDAVGDSHASVRTSLPTGAYFDNYTFHTDGYLVEMTPFVSVNPDAYSEYILPKARIIDQRIRQRVSQ